ncbi:MAG TPA: Ldh family oxidoreductase [Bacteroidales bacterium]|nr:Ldh family oxidoreductase [Bacteroidales bacterium]HPF02991.1 Ldh family oxidoreductase [Bacteroidales bacterium]HPJ60295.1 Ldh family oxidoreductase [Bacteroidales bacterium]HRW86265.1 Ldh family oxidoreductase [Bacteroidales bacterium]
MYTYDYLYQFTTNVFLKMGCSEHYAEIIAEVFMAAEMRGHASHGMIRIKDYFELWKAGRINVRPDVRIVHESPSTAVVDGDRSVGMVAARKSMEIAIEKADKAGTGWVATRNSNHFGIAGYYAMMALEHDMIGICLTNANPLVAPTFSISRMMGTNPIAVAIPAQNQPPFVADFATTPIARGKLAVAEKKGEKVALGFVQDKSGKPSDDPTILKSGGSMLTLGGDRLHGSHKGYCLSSIVDIFSAVFSGANFGPFVPPSVAYLPVLEKKVGEGTGHFFGAMRIDAFQPADEFKKKMDKWIETFRASIPAEGEDRVLIPGDPEREAEERIRKEGISIVPAIKDDLVKIAAELGINFQ